MCLNRSVSCLFGRVWKHFGRLKSERLIYKRKGDVSIVGGCLSAALFPACRQHSPWLRREEADATWNAVNVALTRLRSYCEVTALEESGAQRASFGSPRRARKYPHCNKYSGLRGSDPIFPGRTAVSLMWEDGTFCAKCHESEAMQQKRVMVIFFSELKQFIANQS